MKNYIICLMILGSLVILACSNISKSNKNMSERNNRSMADTMFAFHFHILDSVINANKQDSVYACCTASIKFMEVNTGIEASSDGTLLGKLSFSKSDLLKWHEWYDNKK